MEFSDCREQRQGEADELVAIESERAALRRRATQNNNAVVATLPPQEKGKTRDKVAEQVGMKPRTFDKERTVYKAAQVLLPTGNILDLNARPTSWNEAEQNRLI